MTLVSYHLINDILVVNNSTHRIDIDKTFNCGQCFRWNKINRHWVGVVANRVYQVAQDKDIVAVRELTNGFNTQADIEKIIKYLDLDTDYSVLKPLETDVFAHEAMKSGKGIRILRQDTWEALISFIISQRNNIPKIKSTVKKLCEALGDKIETSAGVYYTFPSPQRILEANKSDLIKIGLGYRDAYIISAAERVQAGSVNLSKLSSASVSSSKALAELQSMYGVGPKVANCVLLFGMHKLDAFPIDVWMERVIDRYYNGEIDIGSYGSLSGLMQQYMFYHIKNISISSN